MWGRGWSFPRLGLLVPPSERLTHRDEEHFLGQVLPGVKSLLLQPLQFWVSWCGRGVSDLGWKEDTSWTGQFRVQFPFASVIVQCLWVEEERLRPSREECHSPGCFLLEGLQWGFPSVHLTHLQGLPGIVLGTAFWSEEGMRVPGPSSAARLGIGKCWAWIVFCFVKAWGEEGSYNALLLCCPSSPGVLNQPAFLFLPAGVLLWLCCVTSWVYSCT